MKDVAREAGVALGTVSKVVNGIKVGEQYRVRVEEAIRKLDYRVNTYAKGLKSSCTCTVEVMVPNLINPFFSMLANSIMKELAVRGYRMLLCCTDFDPEQEQEYVIMGDQQNVDGIICLSYNPRLQVPENLPLISIDRYFGPRIPCVASDNYGGGRMAAEKLAENGCTRLVFLRSGSNLVNETNKRLDGFVSGCEALGIPCLTKTAEENAGFSVFEEFLREHFCGGKMDFDGIFCVTDSLAHQTAGALRSMGVRIPEDVQIVGFDGIRAFGDMEYTCSTIVQPVEDIAARCVDMVLEKDSSRLPALVCLPVAYAYGGTTKN